MIAQTQGQNIIWYSMLFYVVVNNSEFQAKASDKVELYSKHAFRWFHFLKSFEDIYDWGGFWWLLKAEIH